MAEDHPQLNDVVAVPYRKSGLKDDGVQDTSGAGRKGKKPGKNAPSASTKPIKSSGPTTANANPFSAIIDPQKSTSEVGAPIMPPVPEADNADGTKSKDKHKSKFTPLFTTHGNEIQIKLQGRHPCQCMCTRHDLVNNCVSCGRIVCEQEGSGPCFTCGELVCTREEAAILRRGGLDAEKLRRQICGEDALARDFNQMLKPDDSGGNSNLEAAEAHKQRLLEFDRTAAQRTKVLDDQADYYNENVFMTPEQRKTVREKEKELRGARFQSKLEKNRKFNLDIAGREFKSQSEGTVDMYSEENDPTNWIPSTASSDPSKILQDSNAFKSSSGPSLSLNEELATIPELPKDFGLKSRMSVRIQDRELQEMSDSGTALSIMQPWASFVVMGFKPHEGRDFYTSHRGKLWIASGMKTLPAGDVIMEENAVKALMGDDFLVFPEQYVTGFVLGYVDLVDCITQEEYQQRFPGGLLRYPYIMLFENPQELERKFPVEGKPKLFRLEHRLHELAKRQTMKRPTRIWRPETTYSRFDNN